MPHGCNEDVEELLVKLMVHTDTVDPDVDDDDVPLVTRINFDVVNDDVPLVNQCLRCPGLARDMPHGHKEDEDELFDEPTKNTDNLMPDIDDDDVPLVMHRLPNPDRSGIDAISPLSKNVI